MLPTSSPRNARKRIPRLFSDAEVDSRAQQKTDSPSFAALKLRQAKQAKRSRAVLVPQLVAAGVLVVYLLYFFVLGTDSFWRHVDTLSHPPVVRWLDRQKSCDRTHNIMTLRKSFDAVSHGVRGRGDELTSLCLSNKYTGSSAGGARPRSSAPPRSTRTPARRPTRSRRS